MKPEDQVCNLILSKKLKELGVKQDSLFYWINRNDKIMVVYSGIPMTKTDLYYPPVASAFTVAELGDLLPAVIGISDDESAWFSSDKSEDGTWLANYGDNGMMSLDEVGNTEADARALMLIHLIEEKLLKE